MNDSRMHLRLLFAVVALFLAAAACADSADERPDPASGPQAAFDPAPTPIPDRIILTWSGDPETTQTVTWRTSAGVLTAYAEIAPATASPHFFENALRQQATTVALDTNTGSAHYHSVEFRDLAPNTLYAYRVGGDQGWSEWFQFRTAGAGGPFSFIFLGDAQNNLLAFWSRAIRAAYAAAPQARFMLHPGDLVSHGDDDAQWGAWFRAGGWIHAMLPSIPATGSHEYLSLAGKLGPLTRHWRAQFGLPENGVPGLEEINYFIDYQGVRIVVLDSYRELHAQAAWLDSVLSDKPQRWTIAAFHDPIYSGSRGRDNPELRELWKPVLEKRGVDLVLQGHDHVYARGRAPARSGEAQGAAGGAASQAGARAGAGTGQTGPVYVISVSGPKMYEPTDNRWMDRLGVDLQLFQIITVGQDTLHYEARTVTGECFDAFNLIKQEGMGARLEEIPCAQVSGGGSED